MHASLSLARPLARARARSLSFSPPAAACFSPLDVAYRVHLEEVDPLHHLVKGREDVMQRMRELHWRHLLRELCERAQIKLQHLHILCVHEFKHIIPISYT